jgi:hypothetical protein
VAVAELMIHRQTTKKFYKKLGEVTEKWKARGDVVAVTSDFMQNLPLPHIHVQEIFYMIHFWCSPLKYLPSETSKTLYVSWWYCQGGGCFLMKYIN